MAYTFGSIWDRLNRNALNNLSKIVEQQGKSIQDLVAEGQLTPTQYAQLISILNGKVSRGSITDADLDRNNFEIDQTMISDELRSIITGNAPINAVPADNSLTTEKYVDGSVSLAKLYDPSGILPKAVTFNQDGGTRVRSEGFFLKKDDEIIVADETISISVLIEENGEFVASHKYGWYKDFKAMEDGYYQVRGKVDDDSAVSAKLGVFNSSVYIKSRELPVKKTEFKAILKESMTEELNLINGAISVTGGGGYVIPGSSTRVAAEHVQMKAGETIYLTDPVNYDMAFWLDGTTSYLDTWNTVSYTADDDIIVSFMVRRADEQVLRPAEANEAVKYKSQNSIATISDISNSAAGENVKYVTLNGSDDNAGNSLSSGLKTLRKAVDLGAETVYMERGIYKQTFTATPRKLKILPVDVKGNTSSTEEKLSKIVFYGADEFTGFASFEGIYRKAINKAYPNYQEYFIDKSMPQMTDSNRSQYNCLLWEVDRSVFDYSEDYLLEPLLSVTAVKNKTGSFYYDGNYVYINPKNINNEFHAPLLGNGLNFSGIKELHIEDVTAEFYRNTPMNLDDVASIYAKNCDALYSGYADGFSIDYTNGDFYNCTGAKNRNDGFNLHHYGHTEFFNCNGLYNYDDGISHHEFCTGNIHGGLWKGNGKGGVSPVNHSKVNTYNCIIEENRFGLYHVGLDENIRAISQGNLYLNNETAIYNNGYQLISNDKFVGNGAKYTGSTPVVEY